MPPAGVNAVKPRRAYEGGVALAGQYIEPHSRVADAGRNGASKSLGWLRQMLSCHVVILAVHALNPAILPLRPWGYFYGVFSLYMWEFPLCS